jgi:tRNA nucleotidyltransferase/poly(A) polymerase
MEPYRPYVDELVIKVFEKYGCVKTKFDGINIDITTLREESKYIDSRHPNEIIFTKNIQVDSKRRDFTINSLYIDENYKVFDFYNGIDDLNNKVLRMIGNPDERLVEDPLRILRAYRFATIYGLTIDKTLNASIIKNKDLLSKLNKEKVKEELNKLLKKV